MANIATSGSGSIGSINPDKRVLLDDDGGTEGYKQPQFSVNYEVLGADGFLYRYVQAGGAIAASQTDISVDAFGQATDGGGTYVGTAAFADNEYGFVRAPAAASSAS